MFLNNNMNIVFYLYLLYGYNKGIVDLFECELYFFIFFIVKEMFF